MGSQFVGTSLQTWGSQSRLEGCRIGQKPCLPQGPCQWGKTPARTRQPHQEQPGLRSAGPLPAGSLRLQVPVLGAKETTGPEPEGFSTHVGAPRCVRGIPTGWLGGCSRRREDVGSSGGAAGPRPHTDFSSCTSAPQALGLLTARRAKKKICSQGKGLKAVVYPEALVRN